MQIKIGNGRSRNIKNLLLYLIHHLKDNEDLDVEEFQYYIPQMLPHIAKTCKRIFTILFSFMRNFINPTFHYANDEDNLILKDKIN